MPIKPENKHRYPRNWRKIRHAILERAENHCEFCHVPNGAYRNKRTNDWTYDAGLAETWAMDGDKVTYIVLTTAHLDQTPENNDGMDADGPVLPVEHSNLRALCQRCHNRHDAPNRIQNAARTRRAKQPTGDLFDHA